MGRDFNSDNNILGTLPTGQSFSVSIRYLDETNNEGYCDSNDNVANTSGNATTYPNPINCVNTNPEVDGILVAANTSLTISGSRPRVCSLCGKSWRCLKRTAESYSASPGAR